MLNTSHNSIGEEFTPQSKFAQAPSTAGVCSTYHRRLFDESHADRGLFIFTDLKGRAELARVLPFSVQLSLRGGDKLLELCLILAFLLV